MESNLYSLRSYQYSIITIILILILLILIISVKTYHLNNIEEIDLDNIDLQTGDLILFKWHTVDYLHELFSSFTHVGMVVIINNEKYILETHLKGDTIHMGYKSGGVHLYNLKRRINMYQGHNYILKINDDLINEDNSYTLQNNLNNYLLIPFHDEYRDYYKSVCIPNIICNNCFNYHKKGMFCSEFIGFLLQELGILDQSFNINCLTPSSFNNLYNNTQIPIYNTIYKIIK